MADLSDERKDEISKLLAPVFDVSAEYWSSVHHEHGRAVGMQFRPCATHNMKLAIVIVQVLVLEGVLDELNENQIFELAYVMRMAMAGDGFLRTSDWNENHPPPKVRDHLRVIEGGLAA